MTENEILSQIDEIRKRRSLIREQAVATKREDHRNRKTTVHIPKTNIDIVSGELSDLLGRLLNDAS